MPSRLEGTSPPPRTRVAPALPPDRGEGGCFRVGRAPVAEAVNPWASVFTELDLAAGGIPRLGVQPFWPSFRGSGAACTIFGPAYNGLKVSSRPQAAFWIGARAAWPVFRFFSKKWPAASRKSSADSCACAWPSMPSKTIRSMRSRRRIENTAWAAVSPSLFSGVLPSRTANRLG